MMMQIEYVEMLINKTEGICKKKFNKLEKIDFAYKYWNLSNEYGIEDLFVILSKERSNLNLNSGDGTIKNNHYKEIQSNLFKFMDRQRTFIPLRFKHEMLKNNNVNLINNALKSTKKNGGWLSLYDIDKSFEIDLHNKISFPVYYSYIVNNNEININYITAKEILKKLGENNIPIANCIVKESFHSYAVGELDEYIKTLHKNDKDIDKIKEKTLIKKTIGRIN